MGNRTAPRSDSYQGYWNKCFGECYADIAAQINSFLNSERVTQNIEKDNKAENYKLATYVEIIYSNSYRINVWTSGKSEVLQHEQKNCKRKSRSTKTLSLVEKCPI